MTAMFRDDKQHNERDLLNDLGPLPAVKKQSWVDATHSLEKTVGKMLDTDELNKVIGGDHIARTPERVVSAYNDMFAGCFVEPSSVLQITFVDGQYDEMVYVNDIEFVSVCAHHWLPFFGKAHFAYIPDKSIVGLSKIPRLIDILSRRPQVQEKLTREITQTFQEIVKPKGCGLVMEAYHLCVSIRGVKNRSAYTRTADVRGIFRERPETKQEFLMGIPHEFKMRW